MSAKILESLFCNTEINMSGGDIGNIGNIGSRENYTLLKIVIAVIILFVVYSYFEHKNKPKTLHITSTEIKTSVDVNV